MSLYHAFNSLINDSGTSCRTNLHSFLGAWQLNREGNLFSAVRAAWLQAHIRQLHSFLVAWQLNRESFQCNASSLVAGTHTAVSKLRQCYMWIVQTVNWDTDSKCSLGALQTSARK